MNSRWRVKILLQQFGTVSLVLGIVLGELIVGYVVLIRTQVRLNKTETIVYMPYRNLTYWSLFTVLTVRHTLLGFIDFLVKMNFRIFFELGVA